MDKHDGFHYGSRFIRRTPGIPRGFVFSQSCLQDFQDCPRRFELRHLLRVAWPAVQSEPLQEQERDLLLGQRFHRMAQQHLLGVPAERLEAFVDDPDLAGWWEQFLRFLQQSGLSEGRRHERRGASPCRLYPEASLSAALGGQRLVAQYDLIVVGEAGRLTIYDWKTHRKRPRREWLSKRLQTRVYQYLLVCAGQHLLDGQPVQPENVEMIYWFAAYPDQPEHFSYAAVQFEQDQADLAQRVERVLRLAALPVERQPGQRFPLTAPDGHCNYCIYRSLCERGGRAGELQAAEDELELDPAGPVGINFEQIAEVSF